MIESYRSYVIRVRRHSPDSGVRLDLEDLLGGRRVAVTGEEANILAERLQAMIATGEATAHAQPPRDDGPADAASAEDQRG